VAAAGRHGSAALTISGAIVAVKDGSLVDLEIAGRDVGLDDDLAAALPADQRPSTAAITPPAGPTSPPKSTSGRTPNGT